MSEAHPLSRRAKVILLSVGLLLALGITLRLALGGAHADEDEGSPAPIEAQLDKSDANKPALKLAKDQREALGVQTEAVQATTAAEHLTLHGVVLDPFLFLDLETKRAAASAKAEAARAADAAAQAELTRIQTLHGSDHGASDKALQEAQRVASEAKAQRAAAEGEARAARAAWMQTGLASVAGLADFQRVIVRLDLPMGMAAPARLPSTLQATVQGNAERLTLHVLGLAPGGSPLTGGLALLAVGPGKGLRPGLPLDAEWSGPRQSRLLVPRSSVVYQGANAQVFVQTGEDRFEPRRVEVAFPLQDGLVLSGELQKGERVVSQGALALQGEFARLAEGSEIGAGGV